MTEVEFRSLVERGPVLLDGATGTSLFSSGMPMGVCTEGWVLDHPNVVKNLQKAYVEAGSQIIYAPTFGANRHNLAWYGLDSNLSELIARLVAISKEAASGKAYVAGDMSMTGLTLEDLGGEASFDQIFDLYHEQAQALDDAGVDLFVVETMLSLEETEAALDAIRSVSHKPVMCTLSYDADGTTMYGTRCGEAVETLQALGASAVGLNCSVGPDQLEAVVAAMKSAAEIPIIAKPNAGLPLIDDAGNAVYPMGPMEFAENMKKLVAAGASVIGGCCGTTPEYIRKLRLMLEGKLI